MENSMSAANKCEQNQLIQDMLDKKAARKNLIETIIPYFGLAFIFVFFSFVTNGRFLSPVNVENLINQSFGLVIIAVGAVFVYAHGGKDMSIGAASGCGQLVCAYLLLKDYPIWVALLCCVLVTIIAAGMTAGISVGIGVPVFIGSMCVRTSFNGILQFVTQKGGVVVDYQKYAYMNNPTIKTLILAIFLGLGFYLYNYTSFGKYNKMIGGNLITAEQAGIKSKKLIVLAFIFMGLCVGISAIFSFFRMGKVTGTTGAGVEFNIMIAMALGGVPMAGGEKTKFISAIIGAITIVFLTNGLQVWGLDPGIINGVKGLLFVVIIALSYDRSEGRLVS